MAAVSGNLASVQSAVTLTVDTPSAGVAGVGSGAVSVNIVGTFVGTAVFEATSDGNNWFAVGGYLMLASGIYGAPVTSTTAIGTFEIPVYGYTQVRVRCSSYTSGTITALLDSAGSTSIGQVYANSEGLKASYSSAINAHAPAATPTDWFTIQGSATKTIRITRIKIRGRATAANQYRVSLIKYSVYLTGGTPASPAMIAHDANDAAASALVQTWAGGLPTPGAAVGKIEDESINLGVLGTPVFDQPVIYDYSGRNARAIVLRGTAQYLALNSAAVALPSGSVFDVKVEWTEE